MSTIIFNRASIRKKTKRVSSSQTVRSIILVLITARSHPQPRKLILLIKITYNSLPSQTNYFSFFPVEITSSSQKDFFFSYSPHPLFLKETNHRYQKKISLHFELNISGLKHHIYPTVRYRK